MKNFSKSIETIATELFNDFASINELPEMYYDNEEVVDIIKSARQNWEDAEPEDADTVINDAAREIFRILATGEIERDLFRHYAGGPLSDEYYDNNAVCEEMKQGNIAWEDAEIVDADASLKATAVRIYNIWSNE